MAETVAVQAVVVTGALALPAMPPHQMAALAETAEQRVTAVVVATAEGRVPTLVHLALGRLVVMVAWAATGLTELRILRVATAATAGTAALAIPFLATAVMAAWAVLVTMDPLTKTVL